jgi:hypothetical protein
MCAFVVTLGAAASAQEGRYVAVEGGYRVELAIRPKGVWSFQTRYLSGRNKQGGGRWKRVGREIRLTVLQNGKPAPGPNGAGVLAIGRDGKTLTQRTGGRVFTFRRVGR